MTTHPPLIRIIDDLHRDDIGRDFRHGLGDTPAAFLEFLGRPTLIRVPGRDRSRCRVFSTLLHGNEPSGLEALHRWLRSGAVPAVDMLFFVGSVAAALEPPGFAHRMLPGHRDLNRCFRPPWDGYEGLVACELLELLRARPCEAVVDVHNNTGQNPPYGFVTELDDARVALVSLFADACVLSDLRLGALIETLSPELPSVIIECGRSGDSAATDVAYAGLVRYAEADELSRRAVASVASAADVGAGAAGALGIGADDVGALDPTVGQMLLFRSPIRVKLRPDARVAFGDGPLPEADVTLARDIERHNFRRLPQGTALGWVDAGGAWPLEARGADGDEVSSRFFAVEDGRLLARSEIVPIMITTDERVAVNDCLFYLVERDVWSGAS